LKNKNN